MVSVVISTLDRPVLLRRCLDALAAGRRRPDEVVVVDQGDPAPVAAVVDAARAAGLDVVHVTQERRGLSASQNLGVRTARGEVVAIVDDDCVPDDRWVEVVASTFSAATAPDLLGGRVLPLPAVGDRTVPVSSRTSEARTEHRRPADPWDIGTGGSFAVRRAAYLAVGGNDERLGTGTVGRAGNDLDLFHRLLRAGGTARYEPDLVVEHERSTVEERRQRRYGYGFGVGAAVGRWVRDGDRDAWRILGRWARMRAGELRRKRVAAVRDEARIVAGTVAGLAYGLRQRAPWGADER